MIGRLRGIIFEKQPPQVLIEVSGIGYEVHMPMTCFYELPELHHEVTIFTHFAVREDAQLLYGFNSKQERALFRQLIKVNSVGPKLALAILSGMSAQQFVTAVEHGEIATLVKLPGVGKKTAERLMVEMKDCFKKRHHDLFSNDSDFTLRNENLAPAANDAENEAVSALISLGYKPQEASRMISKLGLVGADCETLIREALRSAI